mgnify:CR=1 FL=1
MLLNPISKREGPPGKLPPQRRERDRHFEALYMQSFIEMRARSPKR